MFGGTENGNKRPLRVFPRQAEQPMPSVPWRKAAGAWQKGAGTSPEVRGGLPAPNGTQSRQQRCREPKGSGKSRKRSQSHAVGN